LHSHDLHSRPRAATAVEIFSRNLKFWLTISLRCLFAWNRLDERNGDISTIDPYQSCES
jgi:hypothetical protein